MGLLFGREREDEEYRVPSSRPPERTTILPPAKTPSDRPMKQSLEDMRRNMNRIFKEAGGIAEENSD